MKRQHLMVFPLILVCLLAGCRADQSDPSVPRVVTQISVISTHEGTIRHHVYTTPAKMKILLNYLRRLDPYGDTKIEPDTFRTDAYEITLFYSDGKSSVYRQIYDQYLQENNGPWKRINPADGGYLLPILSNVPTDIL